MICGVCGKEFEPVRYNQLYRCIECSKRAHIQKVRDHNQHVPKICKMCGNRFIPSQRLRNYCSEECRDAVQLKTPVEIACIVHTDNKEKHLNISVSNASKLGVSYGQYKAMLYLERQKAGK